MAFCGGGDRWRMAFGRRQLAVVLLLFLLAVSSTAARVSKSFKNQVSFGSFHAQDVKEENDEKLFESLLERRMNIELTDYPGTGANHNHDPKTPGRF